MESHEIDESMKIDQPLLLNRTGIMVNPTMSAELIQGTKNTTPSRQRNGGEIESSRADYVAEGALIGSCPVISDDEENVEEQQLAANAEGISVLLDKLGERLAFERQGTRLYEAFLQKLEAAPLKDESSPSAEDLRHICDEELEHFELLQKTITDLGGDATVQTPSADVAGVLSHGVLQIVSDPRTTIPQTLQAMLNAELADNDGWQMLKDLATQLGHPDLEKQCETAFEEEQEHLKNVREWLSRMTLSEATADGSLMEEAGKEDDQDKASRARSKRSSRSRSSKSKKRKK
jgi:rubrerythrin